MEKVRRLEPLPETKRELFLLSGNKCAFPSCEQILLNQFGHFIGEICHIEAAKSGGERFNPNQTNEERRHISNLVLMCPTHHEVTDNVQKYPVRKMQEIKRLHESKAYSGNGLTSSDAESFIDSTFIYEPVSLKNVNVLPTHEFGVSSDEIINTVNDLIKIIARVPRQTRSLLAHCILSSSGEYYLEFDPREIRTRLRIRDEEVMSHAAILQRFDLMSDVDNDEYPHALRQYVISPDRNDDQVWFLIMLREKGLSNPRLLLDIIENLNFIHLEA
ncbi:hypothetical protein [Endozoicomonas sp. 4G]|uniref:hypothetical protein n=1 Tax=Endozoicomonas sp. 4G TaxID=2872754 RepID=UPI002078F11C|nr:hypothetical protein [Endozoicomonas sp. 4G]